MFTSYPVHVYELSCSRGDFILTDLTTTYAKSRSRPNPSCCTGEDHPHHAVQEKNIPTRLYVSRPYPPHQQHATGIVAGGASWDVVRAAKHSALHLPWLC